jgi:hypothetical protein
MSQTGQLVDKGEFGWYGRYYITEDGRRRRVCRALKADGKPIFDKVRARWKLKQLIAENTAEKKAVERGETFREVAARVAAGNKDRLYRLATYVYPVMGDMLPRDITKATVLQVLHNVRNAEKAKRTMRNVGGDISVVLQTLVDADQLTRNVGRIPWKKLPEALPAATKRAKRIRAVLTDDELDEYLTWTHPEERHRVAVRERQNMSCLARVLGGLRTGDLHTLVWESFDPPEFREAVIERQKRSGREDGGAIQHMEIPEMLRPHLKQWWKEQGEPGSGLIFPKLRGKNAGKDGRKHSSHAEAFRTDLRRMWGIDQQRPVTTIRSNGRTLTCLVWVADVRSMTARERTLLENSSHSLQADFHSWRRATAQALKRGNINAQISKGVLNHKNLQTTDLYLQSVETIVIPAASLPKKLRSRIGHTELGTIDKSPQIATSQPDEGMLNSSVKFGFACR